jgi:hypothetical protein
VTRKPEQPSDGSIKYINPTPTPTLITHSPTPQPFADRDLFIFMVIDMLSHGFFRKLKGIIIQHLNHYKILFGLEYSNYSIHTQKTQ